MKNDKQTELRNNRRKRMGVVVSNKMDKTVVVKVTSNTKHPLYKKVVKKTNKFKVHDEANSCNVGDKIEIMETKPLSKDKYFRLVKIIEKAK